MDIPAIESTEGLNIVKPHGKYFIMGKNYIKITEHFPENGKSIDEILLATVEYKIKKKL